ncbi:MAG: hypothetical protein U9Q06_03225 [Nanoarchaeota archaeon]|nr:hypothetical protein [Nanoarchaeota archaeon]
MQIKFYTFKKTEAINHYQIYTFPIFLKIFAEHRGKNFNHQKQQNKICKSLSIYTFPIRIKILSCKMQIKFSELQKQQCKS